MINSRDKGTAGELKVRNTLRELTGLAWERTPGSGALDEKHKLKGDLYIPECKNYYTIEVKNYAEDHLTSKVLVNKSAQLMQWWEQATREAKQNGNCPLLVFKYNRSPIFVGYNSPIENIRSYNHLKLQVGEIQFYVALLEHFIKHEKPIFIK